MTKLSKPLTAAKAVRYYELEYAEAGNSHYKAETMPGRWHGKFAEELGLTGAVTKEQFARMAYGQDPATGTQWIESRNSPENAMELRHRAGYDLTFSAPKTVSLVALTGQDERVRKAHSEAVEAALRVGQDYMQARMGGNNPSQTTGKWAAAVFEHDTARPELGYPAPQLHTHVFVFNMTPDQSGQVRSVQPRELYRIQSFMSAVYQNELAIRLKGFGYELISGANHAPEIKGFTREYLEAESQRSQRIKLEAHARGVSGPEALERIAHAIRENKLKWTPEEVRQAHREHQELFGGQADRVVAASRLRQATKLTPEQSREQAKKSLDYATGKLSERSAVFDQWDLYREALRHGQGKFTFEALRQEVALREKQYLLYEVNHVREYSPGKRYTTPEAIAQEREILQRIAFGKNTQTKLENWSAETVLERYPKLNRAQAQTVADILASPDTFTGLQGMAGVGKTTTLKSLKPSLEQHGYEVIGLAATSGAVKEMRAAGVNAKTLQLHLVKDEPATKARYFIVDEASLASTRMVHEFMRKLNSNDRVLFVGDVKQHESIEAGRIFAQMREAGMSGSTLSHIVRQRNNPELKTVVENLAEGKIQTAVELLHEQKRVHEIVDKDARYKAIAQEYVAASQGRTLIVSPDNASRQALNKAVRDELKLTGPEYRQQILVARQDLTQEDRKVAGAYRVDDVIKFHKNNKTVGVEKGEYLTVVGVDRQNNTLTVLHNQQLKTYNPERAYGVQVYQRAERVFAEGERIQLTAPWKTKGIANRETGTLESVEQNGDTVLRLDKDGRRVSFNLREMRHLDYGYAVTSFSSQGTTVEKVLINVETQNARVQNLIDQRFAYVAVSRAEMDAKIYTDRSADLAQSLGREHDKYQALNPSEVYAYRPDAGQFSQCATAKPEKRLEMQIGIGM